MIVAVPLRHPIVPGPEYAIHRTACDRQIGAVVGADDLVDQRVDRGIFNTGKIVRPLGLGRLRRKERTQAVARRSRHAEALDGHVEIEILQPGAKLHRIDHAQVRLDPKRSEILDVKRVMRLERRLVHQKLDFEHLAVRQHPLAVLDGKSGVQQQLRGLAQYRPVLSGPIGYRRHVRRTEHGVRHLAAKRLQQLEFFRRRRPVGHQIGILKRRMGARIGAIHDALVGPFEIERLDQRLAHARILELVAADVDEPALRARWRFVGQDLALHPSVLDGGKIVARRPYPRREFLAVQVVLRGEAFECDLAVAVELVAHRVEIKDAARYREIGAPPVLDAVIFDIAVGFEFSDLVRPAAERDIERGFVERPRRVIGLRENRQAHDIKRHVARALFGECDHQRRVIKRFGLHHVAHLLQDQRMALGLQRGEREGGIMRGQFRAVVEFRFRPHRKTIGEFVG